MRGYGRKKNGGRSVERKEKNKRGASKVSVPLRPSKCHDRLDVLYLDKKSIKVLRDQENAHSATFPQSLGRGTDGDREIVSIVARIRQRMFSPVGEFSAEMK